MTWGRQNGDATYCPLYPPVCTYEGMQARLRESYLELGLLNEATVSPVGAAWRYMRSLNPSFNLYQADESHPSIHGSYLAACTFYSTLFHKSVVGNTFISSLTPTDAAEIQNAVHAVVTDSIYLWYEHGNIPMASFSYYTNGNHVQLQNHSLNSLTYSWDFGDGNTSTVTNPFHTYAAAGTYQVTLTVTDSCGSDMITHTVSTGTTSLPEVNAGCTFYEVSDNRWMFNCDVPVKEIQVYDITGKKFSVERMNSSNGKIIFDMPELSGGIYFVRITGNNFSWSGKIFIKR
jgi:hypothetical protein